MPYALVFLVAAIAGGAVATSTLRRGRFTSTGPEAWTQPYREEEAAPPPEEPATTARRRPLPSAPTAQTRVIGLVGLLIAVLIGAGSIALLSYGAWTTLKRAFG